ncbi:AN1-type zinc finger protein 2A isoform X1 [Urocitellus parryii]
MDLIVGLGDVVLRVEADGPWAPWSVSRCHPSCYLDPPGWPRTTSPFFCLRHHLLASTALVPDEIQDVKVPVCPLCNVPIPVKRGEIPDVVVGEHIDKDCAYHPGKKKEKVFTYRCSKEGCKKKEMLPLACAQCQGSFCIQHRHPLDHSCKARCSAISASESKQSSSWLAQRLRWKTK